MDKKEFALSFIETIKSGEKDKIYKFLTSRTIIFIVEEKKEISLDDFISYIDSNLLNQSIEIKRVFESNVSVKIEILSDKFKYDAMIFEIADRRFKRIELM